ncbi:MAG: tetratricopeptide repeat protein [Bacteroidota bacterium]
MKSFTLFISALTFLLFVQFSAQSQTTEELLKKPEELYASLQIPQAKKAIDELLKFAPDNYDILWRATRIYSGYTETLPEKDQEKILFQAKDLAERTIKANPQGMHGYLWRGIVTGKLALFKGVFGAADLVKSVNQDVKKAISLNNGGNGQLALAYYVLGRLHFKLAEKPKFVRMPLGLGFGNIDDALTFLKKSVDLNPAYIMSHLDYARALIEEDQYDEARRELLKIPALKIQTLGDDERKNEAKALLKEIEGK